MIECVIFDLDGTLVKSHKTIFYSTIRTLEKLNLNSTINEDKFYSLLGHHFKDIFNECKIDVPDVERFIDVYKNYYFDFIDESSLYNNVFQVLKYLKSKNVKTGLLTTKGHDQAGKISKHFGISKYLDQIEGRKLNIPIKPEPDQFLQICNNFNVDYTNSLMVGDTELDVMCGKNAKSKTCAVSYGYRDVADLKKLNPDYLIDDLIEICNII